MKFVVTTLNSLLIALGIEHCALVSDRAVSYLVQKVSSLTFVSADSCVNIGHQTSIHLAQYSRGIKDLYLNNCRKIDDEAVMIITECCTQVIKVYSLIK
jgi:hypothetical protein